MNDEGPVRIPKEVLEGLEAVRRHGRTNVLDMPTLRHGQARRGSPP